MGLWATLLERETGFRHATACLDADCKCSFHASLFERCVGGGGNALLSDPHGLPFPSLVTEKEGEPKDDDVGGQDAPTPGDACLEQHQGNEARDHQHYRRNQQGYRHNKTGVARSFEG